MKKKYLKSINKGISLWLTICLIMTMLPIAMSEVSAGVSVSISLNDASYSDEQYTFDDLTVTGSDIKSILISFNKSVSALDRIVLPSTTPDGFTVSSTSASNNYTKRINLDGEVLTADVQNYLRAVAYETESDSQSVQVVVTSEYVQFDTYYSIDTEHYYQYVSKNEGIAWTDAYAEAKGMSYMDRTGYLATIMSKDEDIYVNSLSGGEVGWLGGAILKPTSDVVDSEGDQVGAQLYYEGFNTEQTTDAWYWMNGPEIGEKFYVRTGTRDTVNEAVYMVDDLDAASVSEGYYFNWGQRTIVKSDDDREPNTQIGPNEDSISGTSIVKGKKEMVLSTLNDSSLNRVSRQGTDFWWNDRPNEPDGNPQWDAQGYFVEFGNLHVGHESSGTITTFAQDTATLSYDPEEATNTLSIKLNDSFVTENAHYFNQLEVTGDGIKTILISFNKSVMVGDKIILPPESGFTVSGSSVENDFTKRITVSDSKSAEDVQNYLRQVGYAIEGDEQSIQVVLSSETIEYDTYYNVDTEHYYQFIPNPVRWLDAYEFAKEMTYMGRTGYLATIMSMDEDNYVNALSGGQTGWLGGTILKPVGDPIDAEGGTSDAKLYYSSFEDNKVADGWYWVNGPEIGEKFYSTTSYADDIDGSSSDVETDDEIASYYNWARNKSSVNGHEPNTTIKADADGTITDEGGQPEVVLTTLDVSGFGYDGVKGTKFSWNDLKEGDFGSTGSWAAKGYFVEYGNDLLGDTIDGTVVTHYASDIADLGLTITDDETFSATMDTKIDNVLDDIPGTITLKKDGASIVTLTRQGTGSYSAMVENGEYQVYVDGIDTGKTLSTDQPSVTINYYQIFYKNNHSTDDDSVYSQDTVLEHRKASMPSPPERTGYEFTGWYTDQDTTVDHVLDINQPIAAPTTLYAKWTELEEIVYSVRYQSDDYTSGNVPVDETLYSEGDVATVKGNSSQLSKSGYSFVGWTDGTSTYNAGDTITVTSNTQLTAAWEVVAETYTATYHYNDGDRETFTTQTNLSSGSRLTKPSDPIRSDYEFIGWYKESKSVIPWDFVTDVISNNVMLYAFWDDDLHDVGGTVGEEDPHDPEETNTVEGATVKIYRGNVQVGTTDTTDEDGKFTVRNIPDGNYNLVVMQGTQTITVYVEVRGEDYEFSNIILLPNGNKNSVLNISGVNTPPVVVDGLNELFDEAAIYTVEDQALVEEGGEVEILLNIKPNDEPQGKTIVELAMASDGATSGIILEIDLSKTTRDKWGVRRFSEINETGRLITLNIPIPSEIQGKDHYVIYRAHNFGTGLSSNKITSSPNPSGEYMTVNDAKTEITLYAKYFSTYAISYFVDTGDTGTGSSSGSDRPHNNKIKMTAVAINEGGSISPTGTQFVSKGDDFTYTIQAEEGYMISDVMIDGLSIGRVSGYTFNDIDSPHTISVEFIKVGTGLPYYNVDGDKVYIGFAAYDLDNHMQYIAPEGKAVFFKENPKNFRDIVGHRWANTIDFVTEREIFVGTEPRVFSPDAGMTRAMFMTVIGRMFERSYDLIETRSTRTFTDVDKDAWYGKYVEWGADNGITYGITDDLFDPNQELTHEEMVVMIHRFAQFLGRGQVDTAGVELNFTDEALISDWTLKAVKYTQKIGVIPVREDGRFAPKEIATRAEVATILELFIKYVVELH